MTEARDMVIKTEGVSRHYTMGDTVVKALDDIDLEVADGELIMVVGSSGSGKSTLLYLLACLDTPTSGRYSLAGYDVSTMPDGQLSRLRNNRMGFVFQQFNLLPNLTVLENIALPLVYQGVSRDQRLEKARHYAELLGLGDRVLHRPTELSGGQSQRVAIARALVNDADIVFADEPTGNLDSKTGAEIMNVLFDLNRQGYTIVVVTHDPKYADMGSRKITLSDGRIVEDTKDKLNQPHARDSARPPDSARGMSFFDLFRVGLREGLFVHKMRTALTMLGIVIGVAGVVAMSSFSLGSKQKQADQIRALGANLVRVVDDRLEGEKLSDARIDGSHGLSLSDMRMIRETIPGITAVAGVRQAKLNIVSDADISPRVLGVAGDYLGVNNLRVAEGRFFELRDQADRARVAVIGHAIAGKLGGSSTIGTVLLLGGTPYEVIGVLANRHIDMKGLEASGIADANHDILLPLQTLLSRTKHLDMRSELDEVHIQLETEDMLYESGVGLRRLLAMTHGGVRDFKLVIPLDLLKQKQQAQRLLDILTICVSSIALIVGGIGIMNIMLASVTERIREIGLRRTVGATRRDIRLQFLSESVIIAVTGGVAGIAVALAAVAVTCTALSLPIVVSPFMVCLAVVASTTTGLVFGLYPATQAAAKNPVEALRYE
ncbi:ABC transporter permease [Verrucomicrobiota bacterium]